MVKIVFLVLCLISVFDGSLTSANIECSYYSKNNFIVGSMYHCDVKNNPNIITEESAEIRGITGNHKGSKSNDDVLGFYAGGKTIQYFPKGLDKIFKNIKIISINSCELKEIHQSDLKVFPNLLSFFSGYNKIEVIEAGLFDFNHKLEHVGFWETEIIHIDPNVFDHLTKLRYFWFKKVPCVNQDIYNSREEVQEIIKVVKSSCSNSEFLSLDNQIKNLEIESKTLNSEALSTKLISFEKSFNNSKFSKSKTLNYKFQNLKSDINAILYNKIQCAPNFDVNSSNKFNLTENEVNSTQLPQVQNVSISDPDDVNSGNNLRKTIILTSFLPLILYFLPKNVFEKM